MDDRRTGMGIRSELKTASLNRILESAARRLRCEGLEGAAIATVMKDAGLTHGAFYSHFSNKEELAAAAFRHALVDNRPRWIGGTRDAGWAARLARLARRYLTPGHRDTPEDGCALAAVAGDAARGTAAFRQTFEQELLKSLAAISATGEAKTTERSGNEAEPVPVDEGLAFLALCIGGLTLSRAVADPALSDRILAACRAAAPHLAGTAAHPETIPSPTADGARA